MKKTVLISSIIAIVLLMVILGFVVSRPQANTATTSSPLSSEKQSDSMIKPAATNKPDDIADALKNPGSYTSYSANSLTDQDNVIFFAASWCPTCRSLDREINSELNSIPADLTILKADYDAESALKRKYGVTYQHTLVQVDKSGNLIKKWNGSRDLAAITSQLI